MSRLLKLTFLTEAGGKATFSINNPIDGLTKSEIAEVMTTIVDSKIFYTSTGDLLSSYKATITETDVVEYEM